VVGAAVVTLVAVFLGRDLVAARKLDAGRRVLSVASFSASSQRYVPSSHVLSSRFQKRRVSMSFPSTRNSFHALVSTGNFHASRSVVSICAPAGKNRKRCFSAPSLHSTAPGVYGMTPSARSFFKLL